MTYETILYEKDEVDKFATITINRPDRLNAMNKTVIREMDDAVQTAVADGRILEWRFQNYQNLYDKLVESL